MKNKGRNREGDIYEEREGDRDNGRGKYGRMERERGRKIDSESAR